MYQKNILNFRKHKRKLVISSLLLVLAILRANNYTILVIYLNYMR